MERLLCVVLVALVWLCGARALAQSAEKKEKTPAGALETRSGNRFRYGVDLAVLRFGVARDPGEPARQRNYKAKIDPLPAEFGFFVALEPKATGFRLKLTEGEIQLMSPTLFLLFGPKEPVAQSSLSFGIGMGFFDRTIMIGLAFDLYRGMPALGADGVAGSATAETGIIAWALSSLGEVTPENSALVINLNLGGIVQRFSGVEE